MSTTNRLVGGATSKDTGSFCEGLFLHLRVVSFLRKKPQQTADDLGSLDGERSTKMLWTRPDTFAGRLDVVLVVAQRHTEQLLGHVVALALGVLRVPVLDAPAVR